MALSVPGVDSVNCPEPASTSATLWIKREVAACSPVIEACPSPSLCPRSSPFPLRLPGLSTPGSVLAGSEPRIYGSPAGPCGCLKRHPLTWLPDAVRYLEMLPDAVLSHGTAARLHGLALPRRIAEEPLLHISRSRAYAPPRRRHVSGHRLRLEPDEITYVHGLPVTSVARTWLDLAGTLSLDELVVMADQIVSEHHRSFGPPRRPMVPWIRCGTWSNGGPEFRGSAAAVPRLPTCGLGWIPRRRPG